MVVSMQNDYELKFDISNFHELDTFALLADQSYNYGDKDDWFGYFRRGIYGLYARIIGVQVNYYSVHSWALPTPFMTSIQRSEFHLSSILFNMDSAIECMVFGINALGYIVDSKLFKNITDKNGLSSISPYNIIGTPPNYSKGAVAGYDSYFPSLKGYWQQNRDLLRIIRENHDVSKHRSVVFTSGSFRDDPPPGFFERLGISGDQSKQVLFRSMAEILLPPNPKTPAPQRRSYELSEYNNWRTYQSNFVCSLIPVG